MLYKTTNLETLNTDLFSLQLDHVNILANLLRTESHCESSGQFGEDKLS